METKGFITKKEKESGLYQELYLEAIEILQKLCNKIWTDYNEHDPGITILQNLVYAITELHHKTSIPIQDLLITKEGSQLKSGDNSFFIASDILTTSPITFNDYRKVWIDQVSNVKNIWVHPIDNYNTEIKNTKGLLHIFVEKYIYQTDPNLNEKEDERIIKEIYKLYHEQRNLCEDLYDIEVYKPLTIEMDFNISISNQVNTEEIFAEILKNINDYLTPEVKYYSLYHLQKEETPINEIYNGPKLSNGFILEKDLQDPLLQINISDIIKTISKISGVLQINKFLLLYKNQKTNEKITITDQLKVPKNTIINLTFPESNEDLIFENSGVHFTPDLSISKQHYFVINALNYGEYKETSNSSNNIQIPKGTYRNIESYLPLREQFPELYGIGSRGISLNSTPSRQAQVKQLQAYLLPFDQIMNNFLIQLKNVATLYDVNHNEKSSYYTTALPDSKNLIDLIKPIDRNIDDSEILSHWNKVIDDLNTKMDMNALHRFNNITDHLLARFSEIFNTYSLRKINSNSYGEALNSEKSENELLELKRKLVREYDIISYNRAKSFNYKKIKESPTDSPKIPNQYLPGALRKIAILTGINNFSVKPLTQDILKSKISIHPRSIEIDIKIREIDIEINDEHLKIIQVEDIRLTELIQEDLHNVMHYVGDEKTILQDVLRNGVLQKNYGITKNPNKELYYVTYERDDQQSSIAHIAKSYKEALNSIKKSINYLTHISKESEGFFILEHLLLLPPYQGAHFGFNINFSILNHEIELELIQPELTSCSKRDHIINTITQGLYNNNLEYNTIEIENCYVLEVQCSQGNILAVSKNSYNSIVEVDAQIKLLQHHMTNKSIDILENLITCNVYYTNKKDPIEETFFSFQMSFIIPCWPIRFQNKNFKHIFSNTIYEHIPIHLKTNTHWLNFKQLLSFENLYFNWLELVAQKNKTSQRMHLAYQLIQELKTYQKLKKITE